MADAIVERAVHAYDVVIVGAGVVGAPLAAGLGRAGRRVLLLERDLSEPDRIVGELLQPGGVRALQLLGMEKALEGIDAIPVEGYAIFMDKDESIKIDYPSQPELPARYGRSDPLGNDLHYEGRSFHYGRFIMALRQLAINTQNVDVVQATAQDLIHGSDGGIIGVRAGDAEYRADVTVVADGCFSKFRKSYGGSRQPLIRSHFVGLELPPDVALVKRHGHVILNKNKGEAGKNPVGPVLVYQIGSDATRILVDVPSTKLPSQQSGELQSYLENDIAPQLPGHIGTALIAELRNGTRLRTMPNNFLPPNVQGQSSHQRGLIVVGDAMNMRHPLTGGGMTVALWDVAFLIHILGKGSWSPLDGTPQAFPVPQSARSLSNWSSIKPLLKSWHWRRKKLASVINVLAQALYSLFGVPDDNLTVLRLGCFRYFELGGDCVRAPISLLGGLAPDPLLLVYHFFAVAIYSVQLLFQGRLLSGTKQSAPKPSFVEYPALILRSVVVLYYACVVILPVLFTEIQLNLASPATSTKPLSISRRTLFLAAALLGFTCLGYSAIHRSPATTVS
ncbi:squalene monooxygenase [Malassezia psittaci]|uniref:Squalene monooxygenase n=1 Tax=Malassezia psittaci TaxID=1821823 RepID=A0AAF0FBS5_9BASI|nr:squalene monooxygenase [Malassezia psittaci]